MTRIEGLKEWSEIPLIEDGDIFRGGINGKANAQATALVSRTNWIKDNLKNVVTEVNGKTPIENKVILTNQDIGAAAREHFHDEEYMKSFAIAESDAGKVITVSAEGSGFELRTVSGLPVGSIIAFGGINAPSGFLECNGATLNRTTFAGLFAAIGTVWGEPSPTTFKVPNFTEAERFLRSRSETLPIGTVQGDAIRNITGTFGHLISYGNEGTGVFKRIGTTGDGIGKSTPWVGNYSFEMDVSKQLPTADENRPKSAVVMYCIKVSDSVLNPEQLLAQGVVGDVANKADRTEIRELAGTRFHMSGEHTPVLNYMTNWNHNRNIDPLYYKCDVLLKCIVDDSITGFLKGDVVSGVMPTRTTDGGTVGYGLVPILYSNTIQLFTGSAGLIFPKKNGGFVAVSSFTNWRYIFRIWY